MSPEHKPLVWIADSRKRLREFPDDTRSIVGFALRHAQAGGRHVDAKPLKGFGGAGVLEIVEDHDGDTYRAVYTVRFQEAVYVLHAFKKKSKRGIKTPLQDIETIKSRYANAARRHEAWISERRMEP